METRTQRLKQTLLDSPFEVCAERAVLWTESHKRTEGRPQVIRNALALKHLLENMTVFIGVGELIVGNRTSKVKGAPLFPETKSFSIETQLDTWESRPIQPFRVGAHEKKALKKVLPYWRGKTVWDLAHRLMPSDLQLDVYKLVFAVEAEFANGIGHFIVGNHRLLALGLEGIAREARQRLESGNGAGEEERHFWEAVAISCEAAIGFGRRFAAEARRLAASEADPRRKEELQQIASACERVPALPPQDFRQALQAVWFNQLVSQLECGGFAISPGRLDQLLYPFYVRDLESGAITPEHARELIECLFIKMSGVVNVLDTVLLPVTSGPPIAQSLTIGGVDGEGADATNELSYLFLEAFDWIRTVSPNLAVRFHPATPREFSLKVFDAVRRGAMMSLFNDRVIVESLERRGVPQPEARGYAIVGCVEPTPSGSAFGSTDANLFNIARCLELALHDGDGLDFLKDRGYAARKFGPYLFPRRSASNGKRGSRAALLRYFLAMSRRTDISLLGLYRSVRGRGVGVRTGKAGDFRSVDDLLVAFQKQVSYFVSRMVEAMDCCDRAHARLKPTPFISAGIDDCLARGRDVTRGGARYNYTGPQAIGLADVADSLAAIKELVFDRGAVSMDKLLHALKNDFKGEEPLRQMLLNKAPKYGNDNEDADGMAREAAAVYCREVSGHKNFRDGSFSPGIYSMSSHIVFGILTGATPDGRRAGESLAAGVSPVSGRELKGPTAVMRSVARVDAPRVENGYVLNMSFNPSLAAGDSGLARFMDLNLAYFREGGLHVQHNVIPVQTLLDAQENPDRYRGLVVRVAGYSALFTQLDRATQRDIISRVQHGCAE